MGQRKEKPEMLVNAVVTRNSAVQPSSRFPAIIPNTAMNPEEDADQSSIGHERTLKASCSEDHGVLLLVGEDAFR